MFKKAGILEKPLYMTFATKEEGMAYEARLMKLLDQGIVPTEAQPRGRVPTMEGMDRQYQRDAHPSNRDRELLKVIVRAFPELPLFNITSSWVDEWIESMKREEHLAPASIRSRVGALARAVDWATRKGLVQLPDQPLRSLPKGYAQYTKMDTELAGVERVDVERDRRLEPDEETRILAVMKDGVLARKQRPYAIPHPEATRFMFVLALESAMRMREIYTLTLGQLNMKARTIFLEKTKNGDKRQVPMSSVIQKELPKYLGKGKKDKDALLVPFWDRDDSIAGLKRASNNVSEHYQRIFLAAGCEDLRFHDLRHEATSRLFERTTLNEMQIAKITGHKTMKMLMRYANLRGSNLSDQLW
jgi:integrase